MYPILQLVHKIEYIPAPAKQTVQGNFPDFTLVLGASCLEYIKFALLTLTLSPFIQALLSISYVFLSNILPDSELTWQSFHDNAVPSGNCMFIVNNRNNRNNS